MNPIVEKIKNLNFVNTTKDEESSLPIFKIGRKITASERKEYENNGIDLETYLKGVQVDEMYHSITGAIFNSIGTLGMNTRVEDVDLDYIFKSQERENKIKDIFGEEKVQYPIYQNVANSQRIVASRVEELIQKLDANIIVTNGSIGASLQDLYEYEAVAKNESETVKLYSGSQYFIGKIFGCEIYIDAYMKFNDNRIFVSNVEFDFIHNDNLKFKDDFTELEYGYDVIINPNSKVEVLNIIDKNMMLL